MEARTNWIGNPIPPVEDFQPTREIKVDPKWPPDILTIEVYMSSVECGAFIDDDGYGHPCIEKDGKFWEDQRHDIVPSLSPDCIPLAATHVNWFNK